MFIAIKAQDFINLIPLTSTEATRYYLGGVHVCKSTDGEYINLVATDGQVAGLYQVDPAFYWTLLDQNIILKLSKDFQTSIKQKLKKNDHVYLVFDGDFKGNQCTIVAIAADHLEADTQDYFKDVVEQGAKNAAWLGAEGNVLIDGTYPDYARIYPDPEKLDNCEFTIDFNHIKRFSHLSDTKSSPLHFASSYKESPVLIKVRDERFLGLIMPIRNAVSESFIKP